MRGHTSVRALVLVALVVLSVFAPMVALGAGVASAAPSSAAPPAGLVGVDSSNIDDIRPGSVPTDVSADDLSNAVYTSKHASTTEVDIVTGSQAGAVARGASPADIAGERVCANANAAARNPAIECDTGAQLALVISDDVHHEGRTVAVRTSVVEEALGFVPETIAVANNETGETWRSPAEVRDGWLVADVEHFSSNSVSFTGTISVTASPAQDGDSFPYEVNDLDSVSNYTLDITGHTVLEWDNETKTGVSSGSSTSVSPAGNLDPTGPLNGNVSVEVTGRANVTQSHGNGTHQTTQNLLSGTYNGSFTEPSPPDYITSVGIMNDNPNAAYDMYVDVYIIADDGGDSVYGEGTKVASNVHLKGSGKASLSKIPLDSPYDASTAQNVTVEFVVLSSSGDPITIEVNGDARAGAGYNYGTTGSSSEGSLWLYETPHGLSVTADTGESATVGTLVEGETKTVELPIGLSTSSLSWSSTSSTGALDYTLKMRERTETENVTISVNGNDAPYASRLADGATTSLSTNTSWIVNGTNYVNVSVAPGLSADAPTPSVGLDHRHEATSTHSTNYSAEELTVRYEVGKNYTSDQTGVEMNISFDHKVYEMRDIEKQVNGGGWSSVSSSNYRITDANALVVDIGSVTSGDTVEIRANGSRMETQNMTVTVVEPTTAGDELDSKIRIESKGQDARMVLAKGSSAKLYYPTLESWSSPKGYVTIESSGRQTMYLPNSAAGETFRLKQHDTEVVPSSNDVEVRVTDSGIEPQLRIMPGDTEGDEVKFIYYATTSGETYVLDSVTHDTARDQATANSPVVLWDDDGLETLEIYKEDGSATTDNSGSSSGSSLVQGAKEATSDLPPLVILFGALVITVGLYYLDRRTPGERHILLVIGAVPTWLVGLELMGVPVISLPIVALTGGGTGGVIPAIALAFTGLVIYVVYSWWTARKDEAKTPDKVTNVDFNLSNDKGGN